MLGATNVCDTWEGKRKQGRGGGEGRGRKGERKRGREEADVTWKTPDQVQLLTSSPRGVADEMADSQCRSQRKACMGPAS